jgi:hypothetical protein
MCTMCGCNQSGNNGDIKSPDVPMSKPEMFGTDSINPLGA